MIVAPLTVGEVLPAAGTGDVAFIQGRRLAVAGGRSLSMRAAVPFADSRLPAALTLPESNLLVCNHHGRIGVRAGACR